jgi:hypothetical protein
MGNLLCRTGEPLKSQWKVCNNVEVIPSVGTGKRIRNGGTMELKQRTERG